MKFAYTPPALSGLMAIKRQRPNIEFAEGNTGPEQTMNIVILQWNSHARPHSFCPKGRLTAMINEEKIRGVLAREYPLKSPVRLLTTCKRSQNPIWITSEISLCGRNPYL